MRRFYSSEVYYPHKTTLTCNFQTTNFLEIQVNTLSLNNNHRIHFSFVTRISFYLKEQQEMGNKKKKKSKKQPTSVKGQFTEGSFSCQLSALLRANVSNLTLKSAEGCMSHHSRSWRSGPLKFNFWCYHGV